MNVIYQQSFWMSCGFPGNQSLAKVALGMGFGRAGKPVDNAASAISAKIKISQLCDAWTTVGPLGPHFLGVNVRKLWDLAKRNVLLDLNGADLNTDAFLLTDNTVRVAMGDTYWALHLNVSN